MPDIAVINFQRQCPIPVTLIKKTAIRSIKALKLEHEAITIVFAGTVRMRSINRKFLGHDYVTDVITFDHGDIIICPQVAKRFAKAYGQDVKREILLYVVHGLLHLAGYDDKKEEDIKRMRAMEKKLIGAL